TISRGGGGDIIDVWVHDLALGVRSRLPTRPGLLTSPVWSADGNSIVFGSVLPRAIYQKRVNSADEEELLLESGINMTPFDWSRDGKSLLYSQSREGERDLWWLPLDGSRQPRLYGRKGTSEQVSPDGR